MQRISWLILAAAIILSAADVNEDLLAAARKGDLASVKALIEKGAALETKTSYGQTPLYLAAMNGHQDVVDTFYKAPMLIFVLQRKHYGVAKAMIAKGSGNLDENLAAVGSNADLVQAVLEKGKPSQSALDKAYEAALDRKQTAISEILKKAGAQEPSPPMQVDAKVLDSYAGVYKTDRLLDIKVFTKDGKLYLQAPGQPELAMKAKSPTVFEFPPARMEVEFDSAASFTLKQGGQNYKFKKAVTP
jgi:ankyrin repeat protein